MQYLILTSPGERYGPCKSCDHDECRRQRETAGQVCHLCRDFVGYGRAYCYDPDARPIHFACLAAEIQRQASLLGVKAEATTSPNQPLVYDKPTAARLLGIGESTLNEAIANDEISRVKIGVRILFRRDALLDYLDRHEVPCKHDRVPLRAVK